MKWMSGSKKGFRIFVLGGPAPTETAECGPRSFPDMFTAWARATKKPYRMKRFVCLAWLAAGLLALSSCSYSVYPKTELDMNYELSMTSKKEKQAKEQVAIYFREADVPAGYEVIALVHYSPFLKIPVLFPEKKQQLEKFEKKAVLKARELGGNGVLVTSVGHFKVIRTAGK